MSCKRAEMTMQGRFRRVAMALPGRVLAGVASLNKELASRLGIHLVSDRGASVDEGIEG